MNLNSEDIRDLAIKALDEMKGIDIVPLDVRTLTSITDYMIICTGRSTRHVKGLADHVVMEAKAQQLSFVHIEGERESEWILVDLGDVVVHVMLAATRSFYSLEDLWVPIKEMREHQSHS
jgi:ribosome-associated protein